MKFAGETHLNKLIGWKPRAWAKNGRRKYHGNGRTDPKGPRHTKSPVAIRRKARHNAARRAA